MTTDSHLAVEDIVAANPAQWNANTCAEVNDLLTGASATELAQWAVATFATKLIVAASMQDTILPHMFGAKLAGVDVLFLETGYHFKETIETRDEAAKRFPITIVNAMPAKSVAEQDVEFGKELFARDPNLCCFMRKVDPLARSLAGYDAWVTGARRIDAVTRSEMPLVTWDQGHGLVKINPIAAWSDMDVEVYQMANALPRNPLVAQGFPSIGCQPCTNKVAPGEDPRSGRWAGQDKTECGIHE